MDEGRGKDNVEGKKKKSKGCEIQSRMEDERDEVI